MFQADIESSAKANPSKEKLQRASVVYHCHLTTHSNYKLRPPRNCFRVFRTQRYDFISSLISTRQTLPKERHRSFRSSKCTLLRFRLRSLNAPAISIWKAGRRPGKAVARLGSSSGRLARWAAERGASWRRSQAGLRSSTLPRKFAEMLVTKIAKFHEIWYVCNKTFVGFYRLHVSI